MNARLKDAADTRPKFARERGRDVMGQIGHLLEEHYEEVTHHRDIPVGCNYEAYLKIEAAGMLRIFTVRVQDELVGYGIYTVAPSMHYCSSLQARQDTLFLSKSFRRGFAGYRFLKWIDAQLKTEGVQIVYQHGKFVKNIQSIFERLGYAPVYYVYGKRLDHGDQ